MFDINRERESIEMCSLEADLTPEEEYQFYSKYALRTKEDILTEIKVKQENMRETDLEVRSETFYQRLHQLLETFYEEVSAHLILGPLDDFWGYIIRINETGIKLMLEHLVVFYEDVSVKNPEWREYKSDHVLVSDDGFPILEVKPKLLTTEEYGSIYGVEAGTIRQWIQKGELKSAAKFGDEWRIPELADKPKRENSSIGYIWETDLPDPPAEIPDINFADALNIYKDRNNNAWTIVLFGRDNIDEVRKLSFDTKTKEKLELYLIGHPFVKSFNGYVGVISQKYGSEYEMMKPKDRPE